MNMFELPNGYSEIKRVDLQKDKKLALLVNGAGLLATVALFFIGNARVRFYEVLDIDNILSLLWVAFGLLAAMIAYIVLHELIHGVFIRLFSGKKAKFGFTGLYAYAGSDAYFNRRQYLIIALAPVVMFGLALLPFYLLLDGVWFWAVYFIQIVNLSGAVGDIYITWRVLTLPADLLIRDEGVAMVMCSKSA